MESKVNLDESVWLRRTGDELNVIISKPRLTTFEAPAAAIQKYRWAFGLFGLDTN